MLAGSKIKEDAHITHGSLFTVAALVPAALRIPSDLTLEGILIERLLFCCRLL